MTDNLCTRIKTAIKNSGLNQAEVARRVGVTPQAITKWLKNGNIDKNNLHKLCKITGASYEWVLTGHDRSSETPSKIQETARPYSSNNTTLLERINALSPENRARLIGYLDALEQQT